MLRSDYWTLMMKTNRNILQRDPQPISTSLELTIYNDIFLSLESVNTKKNTACGKQVAQLWQRPREVDDFKGWVTLRLILG